MGIRFSKSIKFSDLFKLNISKTGISASIGKKGASLNIGRKGTYLNISPKIVGISGTGIFFRKKITGGYSTVINKIKNYKDTDANDAVILHDTNVKEAIKEYEKNLNESIYIHKLSDKVLSKKDFINELKSTNDNTKDLRNKCNEGDEETIESLIKTFFLNFDFVYPINANYELENNILYLDLDLPEIEEFSNTYPTIIKEQIINKKKSKLQLKKEYAYTVMSLSAYISSQIFNISYTIKEIHISGFTSKRDKKGDLIDLYIYSIKYLRNIFENINLDSVDNIYEFINMFENRIVLDFDNYNFKPIKPYEMPTIKKRNEYIDNAIMGLKELGYKNSTINEVIPLLNNINFDSSSDYLKEALKLISNK